MCHLKAFNQPCWVCTHLSSAPLILHPPLSVLHTTNCWTTYLNTFKGYSECAKDELLQKYTIFFLNITVAAPTLRRCLWNLSYVLLPCPIITMVNLGVTLLLRRTLTGAPKYCSVFWALEEKSIKKGKDTTLIRPNGGRSTGHGCAVCPSQGWMWGACNHITGPSWPR